MFGRGKRMAMRAPMMAAAQQGSAQAGPDMRVVSPDFDQATNQQIMRQNPNPMNLGMYNKLYQEPDQPAHHVQMPQQGGAEQRMREYDRQHGVNPDAQMHVSRSRLDDAENYRVANPAVAHRCEHDGNI